MLHNVRAKSTFLLIVALGALFAVCGPVDMVLEGPFSWAIQQPGAWQGAIELATLALLIGATTYYLTGWRRGLILGILCFIYARRQGVDFAILGSLAYFEGIVSLGLYAYHRLVQVDDGSSEDYLIAIVIGLVTWSCIQWTLSAIGFGSLRDLEIAAMVILGNALLLAKRPPMLAFAYSRLGQRNLAAALASAFACTVVLMLFAKSAISIDFDSLWYGMRGDRVLVSAGSVFRDLGLVAPVHYAPQAYELLLAPLSGLHSVPAIFGFAIWCMAALGFCLYSIGGRLGWKPALSLMLLGVALATPAILNIAITAKGDILAAFWIFFGLYAFIRYRQSSDWRWLVVMLATAPVAISYRMSAFIYAGLIAIVACFHLAKRLSSRSKATIVVRLETGLCFWVVTAALLLFAFVTIRTYLLAGIPFVEPGILVRAFEALGFIRKFPAGNAPPQEISFNSGILGLLLDFIFRPGRLPHILIGWPGAAFVFLPAIGLLLNKFRVRDFGDLYVFWLFAGTLIATLLFVHFPDRGGDGNYFIVPVLSFLVVGLGLVGDKILQKDLLGRSLRFALSLFVISSILVALVTGSWGPGTRGFDLDFKRPIMDFTVRARAELTYNGMLPIYDYLRTYPPDTRIVSAVPDSMQGKLPDSWLPVRDESLIAIAVFMPPYTRSADSFEEFLMKDHIQYVMLPTEGSSDGSSAIIEGVARPAITALQAKHQAVVVVAGKRFMLWKIGPRGSNPEPSCLR